MTRNDSQSQFSSFFRYMHIIKKGTVLVSPAIVYNVPHGLTYRPFVDVFIDMGLGLGLQPAYRNFTNSGATASDPYFVEQNQLEFTVQVNDTDVQLTSFDNTGGSRACTAYVRIFAEAAG